MFKQIAVAAIIVVTFTVSAKAQQRNNFDAGGVCNSSGPRSLNERQLQMLQESLQQKTGFVELEFDRYGALTLGNRQNIAGGSATARALLASAVDSANPYELESHEHSPEIAFAEIRASANRQIDTGTKRTTIHQLQLDFADFNYLSGAREAKASFDIGIAMLHELAHGVLKLQDPPGNTDQIGECDAHINQIRRELQLPERLYYHPGISVTRISGVKTIVCARLVFVERATANSQPSAQYSLSWLASQVAPNAPNIAGLQKGLLKPRRR